ncbi:MAG: hypothetical protein GY851_22915 [bacterium]|nr:hypothetical protein [bacterium]
MGMIAIPSNGPEDWQQVLADPLLHWRSGASAMTLAVAWEDARGEFPPEVDAMLNGSSLPELRGTQPLLVIPEYGVALPGGSRASKTDAFVVAKGNQGLVTIAVEGKVDEPFGPLVGEKRRNASDGQSKRLEFLRCKLGLSELPDDIRYQLLHRSASALLTAEDFGAVSAVMLVHSFSAQEKWFDDFQRFAELLGVSVEPNRLYAVPRNSKPSFSVGWCCGDLRFTELDLTKKE